MAWMTSHIDPCFSRSSRRIAVWITMLFTLLSFVTPGRSDPAPGTAPATITQQGTMYIVDEGNGITVELSPTTGVFHYLWNEHGQQQHIFQWNNAKNPSPAWIFVNALRVGDPILVRLWLQQFPALIKAPLPGSRQGETALTWILSNRGWPGRKHVPCDLAGVVEVLLAAGVDPNQNDQDTPPLDFAIWKGQLDIAKALVAHGADVNALDGQHRTPRFDALISGARDIADFLHEKGGVILPDAPPLHQAAAEGDVEALGRLLKASPYERNTYTPDTNYTPLMLASLNGQLPAVKALLAAGADVDMTGYFHETALYFATACASVEIVQALLKQGAAVDPVRLDAERDPTPLLTDLYCLTWYPAGADTTTNRVAIARELLAHGANPEAIGTFGEGRALHVAAELGNLALAELLLNAHASIDSRDRQGQTPLFHAVQARQLPMVEWLIAHGADVNAVEKDGKVVLQLIRPEEPVNQPIYQYLIAHGAKIGQQPKEKK